MLKQSPRPLDGISKYMTMKRNFPNPMTSTQSTIFALIFTIPISMNRFREFQKTSQHEVERYASKFIKNDFRILVLNSQNW